MLKKSLMLASLLLSVAMIINQCKSVDPKHSGSDLKETPLVLDPDQQEVVDKLLDGIDKHMGLSEPIENEPSAQDVNVDVPVVERGNVDAATSEPRVNPSDPDTVAFNRMMRHVSGGATDVVQRRWSQDNVPWSQEVFPNTDKTTYINNIYTNDNFHGIFISPNAPHSYVLQSTWPSDQGPFGGWNCSRSQNNFGNQLWTCGGDNYLYICDNSTPPNAYRYYCRNGTKCYPYDPTINPAGNPDHCVGQAPPAGAWVGEPFNNQGGIINNFTVMITKPIYVPPRRRIGGPEMSDEVLEARIGDDPELMEQLRHIFYEFSAKTDDGTIGMIFPMNANWRQEYKMLWYDWNEDHPATDAFRQNSGPKELTPGWWLFTVHYYENQGGSSYEISYNINAEEEPPHPNPEPTPIPPPSFCENPNSDTSWVSYYYNDSDMRFYNLMAVPASPGIVNGFVFSDCERNRARGNIEDEQWHDGGPGHGIENDGFTVAYLQTGVKFTSDLMDVSVDDKVKIMMRPHNTPNALYQTYFFGDYGGSSLEALPPNYSFEPGGYYKNVTLRNWDTGEALSLTRKYDVLVIYHEQTGGARLKLKLPIKQKNRVTIGLCLNPTNKGRTGQTNDMMDMAILYRRNGSTQQEKIMDIQAAYRQPIGNSYDSYYEMNFDYDVSEYDYYDELRIRRLIHGQDPNNGGGGERHHTDFTIPNQTNYYIDLRTRGDDGFIFTDIRNGDNGNVCRYFIDGWDNILN